MRSKLRNEKVGRRLQRYWAWPDCCRQRAVPRRRSSVRWRIFRQKTAYQRLFSVRKKSGTSASRRSTCTTRKTPDHRIALCRLRPEGVATAAAGAAPPAAAEAAGAMVAEAVGAAVAAARAEAVVAEAAAQDSVCRLADSAFAAEGRGRSPAPTFVHLAGAAMRRRAIAAFPQHIPANNNPKMCRSVARGERMAESDTCLMMLGQGNACVCNHRGWITFYRCSLRRSSHR
jgi:hypothetical protein